MAAPVSGLGLGVATLDRQMGHASLRSSPRTQSAAITQWCADSSYELASECRACGTTAGGTGITPDTGAYPDCGWAACEADAAAWWWCGWALW